MLVVLKDKHGRFECFDAGATGMYVVGRGASVLEAVGSWAIHTLTVEIKCDPPSVLDSYTISNDPKTLNFKKPDSR